MKSFEDYLSTRDESLAILSAYDLVFCFRSNERRKKLLTKAALHLFLNRKETHLQFSSNWIDLLLLQPEVQLHQMNEL